MNPFGHAPDPSERLERLLRLPADETSRTALLEAVEDPSPDVARRALRRLVPLAGPVEVAALRELLLDLDAAVVGHVARALRELGDQDAVDTATFGLQAESSFARQKAAIALRELGDAGARAGLVRTLADPEASVRRAALEALEQLPTEPATVEACAARLDDEDPLVRAAAVGVLAALDPRARTTLAHAVGDPHAGVRRRLGQVSRVLDGGDIVILLRDEDADVRTATLAGLAHGRRPDLSPSIAASLDDPSWHVRAAACDALGTGGERASATALVPALVDAHPMVRGRALVALERLLGDGLDDALVARLDDAPASLRRAIVEILGRHGCAAELARRELDSDADVRLAVVHALEGSASHAAGGTLRLLAGDEDPAVRSAATLAVEAAGDART